MMQLALKNIFKSTSVWLKSFVFFISSSPVTIALAASSTENLGDIASNITSNFSELTNLITACSYIAGLGFAIGSIMKFKMHKDNPTQVPIGTPISLVFIAAALLFLPSILSVTEYTVFGTSGGEVAGPSGTVFE
jgi:intracellular multiplication protein IcmD